MEYFNAVLIPPDNYKTQIMDFCKNNLQSLSDGYCLGETAFPHITLCQFKAAFVPNITPQGFYSPVLLDVNHRKGWGKHEGFMWYEMRLQKDKKITTMQRIIADQLMESNAKLTTPLDDFYAPHITLCRYVESIDVNVNEALLKLPKNWTFEIGRSDQNGQYLGQ